MVHSLCVRLPIQVFFKLHLYPHPRRHNRLLYSHNQLNNQQTQVFVPLTRYHYAVHLFSAGKSIFYAVLQPNPPRVMIMQTTNINRTSAGRRSRGPGPAQIVQTGSASVEMFPLKFFHSAPACVPKLGTRTSTRRGLFLGCRGQYLL